MKKEFSEHWIVLAGHKYFVYNSSTINSWIYLLVDKTTNNDDYPNICFELIRNSFLNIELGIVTRMFGVDIVKVLKEKLDL